MFSVTKEKHLCSETIFGLLPRLPLVLPLMVSYSNKSLAKGNVSFNPDFSHTCTYMYSLREERMTFWQLLFNPRDEMRNGSEGIENMHDLFDLRTFIEYLMRDIEVLCT